MQSMRNGGGGDATPFTARDYIKYLVSLDINAREIEIKHFVNDVKDCIAAPENASIPLEKLTRERLRVISFANYIVHNTLTIGEVAPEGRLKCWATLQPAEKQICQLVRLLAQTSALFSVAAINSELAINITDSDCVELLPIFPMEVCQLDLRRLPGMLVAVFHRIDDRKQQFQLHPKVAMSESAGAAPAAAIPQQNAADPIVSLAPIQIQETIVPADPAPDRYHGEAAEMIDLNAFHIQQELGSVDDHAQATVSKYFHQMLKVPPKEFATWLESKKSKFVVAPRRKAELFYKALKMTKQVKHKAKIIPFLQPFKVMAKENPEDGIAPPGGRRPKKRRAPLANKRAEKRRALNDGSTQHLSH